MCQCNWESQNQTPGHREIKEASLFQKCAKISVTYRGQKSAWIDQAIFEDWYRTEFLPSVTSRKSGKDETFLLLLDNAPSHPSLEKLNAIDSRCIVKYLPPNVTALIQPMDQGVIEAIKKAYRKAFLRELLVKEITDNSNIVQFMKQWTILDCCSLEFPKEKRARKRLKEVTGCEFRP